MCIAKSPKIEKPKITPLPTEAPEEPPAPVEVQKESSEKLRRKKNPLRIDLASSSNPASGVNI